jgi:ribosomal protein S18 acetylase RimI-like enzyme
VDVGLGIRSLGRDEGARVTSSEIRVRPCMPSDAPAASDLILLSMGGLGEFLMGSGDAERAKEVFSSLVAWRRNRFSHEFADLVEMDGKAVGLGLGYPAGRMKRLHLPMALQLLRIYGGLEYFRFLRRACPLVGSKEAESREFYINSVAVSPDLQGRGIGKRLMSCLEEKARGWGLDKCSLCVEAGNHGAKGFYERCGYQTVESLHFDSLRRLMGYEGYHRMVKSF